MPLLEVTQVRHVRASIRLTGATALMVDQYAEFIHASADDVVEQSLTYVFGKDRGFQEFLKTPQAQNVVPALRIRRVPSSDPAEPTGNKSASGVGPSSSVRVLKGPELV